MQPLSDRREEIVRQKRETPALEFAGFWRRLAAFLIDIFSLAVICSVILLTFAPYNWFGFDGLWGSSDVFNEPLWRALPYLIAGNLLSLLAKVHDVKRVEVSIFGIQSVDGKSTTQTIATNVHVCDSFYSRLARKSSP